MYSAIAATRMLCVMHLLANGTVDVDKAAANASWTSVLHCLRPTTRLHVSCSHDPNTVKHPHATHLRLLHIVSKAVEPAYLSNPNPCMHLHPSTHLRLVHLVSEAVEPVYILIQPSFLHAAATHLRLLHLVSQTIKQRCEELVGVLLPCSTPVAGPLPHGLAHDLGTDGRRAGITEATRPGE